MFTLNCKGKLLVIDKPIVMGIVNITPDSFFKGELNQPKDEILKMVEKMLNDGATIIDVGGQSTRPGSHRIEASEEADRVLPVIESIHNQFPELLISIDTYYSSVAKQAVSIGASIVNDVSAGNMDEYMIPAVGNLSVPYICMHMKGTPESMQINPMYEDVVKEELDFFMDKIHNCKLAGIQDIVIDPGFGFGKSTTHNFTLLRQLELFSIFQSPLLVGVSRKGMIYKSLGITPGEALNGTTALHMIALQNGATILRVHDVKEAMECIHLHEIYKKATL